MKNLSQAVATRMSRRVRSDMLQGSITPFPTDNQVFELYEVVALGPTFLQTNTATEMASCKDYCPPKKSP